ncbi:protein kinase domain-containing protein [Kocuria marina]|uniref:non-specific serine/threonine protein kinase n=1 Tax=Kocuria marina subsp. indica TaxID=1049583 RepID=A0A1X7C1Z0_9MICC|nr:protein kinase [Kocuria indica]OXS85741.1 serine/threonine protein kinase [Kocuria indica]RLP59538.1 serine/threonine-protein kinase [Kocuria indica]SME88377.1 serine/threonine protein kinase [Kocuria indica]
MNDHRVGSLLEGRYQVRRLIARGGTATVYEGLDERLERPVALKIMHPHVADDPSFVARARREAKSAARLHHPNVVAVLDQGHTADGVLYLVLEYVDGPTLRDVVAHEAPMTPRRTLDLLIPVLRGLTQAHRIGLVHRDVKPENVLLTRGGQVKVADFGLTRAVDEHTTSTTVMGTVGYAAPELVGDGPVDQRSDVYAVGIMAYEMLTGSRPYTGTALQVATAHVSRDVPAPGGLAQGVPAALDEFVLRATSRDAAQRPADAAALLDLALAIRRSLPGQIDPPSLRDTDTVVLGGGSHASTAAAAVAGGALASAAGGDAAEAPTQALGGVPTEALGDAGADPTGENATTPLGSQHTHGMGRPGERGAGAPILPAFEPDATGTIAMTQVGSTAHRSRDTPRVRLNPQPPALHLAVGAVVFALLLSVAGFLGWWLGSAPGTASATVPAVAGQDTATAERALNSAGISNVGVRSTTSPEVPQGIVIATDPGVSTTVRGIEQVNLVVSEGPARVSVPTVVGSAGDDARAAITGAGLRVGEISREYSAQAVDTVLGQSPAAGTSVDEGTTVALTLAADTPQGAPPNVVGQDADSARQSLEEQGYTVEINSPVGSHLNRVVRQREDGNTVILTVL